MDIVQTDQKGTDQAPNQRKLSPGDDGFQNLSLGFSGRTLSAEDLTNRHEALLLGEFIEGSRQDHPTPATTNQTGK